MDTRPPSSNPARDLRVAAPGATDGPVALAAVPTLAARAGRLAGAVGAGRRGRDAGWTPGHERQRQRDRAQDHGDVGDERAAVWHPRTVAGTAQPAKREDPTRDPVPGNVGRALLGDPHPPQGACEGSDPR